MTTSSDPPPPSQVPAPGKSEGIEPVPSQQPSPAPHKDVHLPSVAEPEVSVGRSAAGAERLRHRRNRWAWFLRVLESVGMFVVAVLALGWSVYGLRLSEEAARQQHAEQLLERAARERIISIQQEDIGARRAQNERQLAAALLPEIGCEYNVRQQVALELLAGHAPEQHMIVASLLLRDCPTTTRAARLDADRARSSIVELEQAFLAALDNAREYYDADLKERAAERFYNLATTRLPDRFDKQVDPQELSRARRAFEDGAFSEAADRYSAAFSAVSAAAALPRR